MSRDDPKERSRKGGIKGGAARTIERLQGQAYARSYRKRQPFKAMLDELYGAEG